MTDAAIFSGAWTLVTGASSGLGEEFSKQLAHLGGNLILVARTRDKLEQFAADLRQINGVEVCVVAADLARTEGIREVCQSLEARGVFVEHLVNNAGFGSTGAFVKSDPERQSEMVRLNAEAVVALSRYFLPSMVARDRGGIINVASTAAHQPIPLMATYAATKAFVLSFSLALADELKRSNVRLLACCPGPVLTGFQAAAGIEPSPLLGMAKLEARVVVERTLEAYLKRRRVYTPGLMNSAQAAVSKLLPSRLVVPAARLAMQGLGRGK